MLIPDEIKATIEAALYFLRASDRIEMHGNQTERIDSALAWLSAQEQGVTAGPVADIDSIATALSVIINAIQDYHRNIEEDFVVIDADYMLDLTTDATLLISKLQRRPGGA